MEYNDRSLTLDCLISIFSFLSEEDLIRVSCVCKEWHEAAETQWLWREMCLRRWGFCNVAQLLSDPSSYTWKRYYLHRSSLELKMKSGRSGGDYSCKSLRGHTGRIVGFSYLKGNSALHDMWNFTPIVCSASTDGTLKAWDIHKGVTLWSSSAQNPLTRMVTDAEQDVVITSDSAGTISAWQGRTGELLSSFSSGSSQCTLMTFSTEGNSFVMVGMALGSFLVLTSPQLCETSRHVVCDSFSLNLLLSSPDKKWILTASKDNSDLSPKGVTLWSSSAQNPLTRMVTDAEQDVVITSDSAGTISAWRGRTGELLSSFSSGSSQCTLMTFSTEGNSFVMVGMALGSFLVLTSPQLCETSRHVVCDSFSLNLLLSSPDKKWILTASKDNSDLSPKVESFRLNLNSRHSDIVLQAKGNNTVLLTDGNDLKVYTLKGELISSFKEHLQPITSVCVDDFRVVTASQDLSLRVLTWRKDRDKGLTLESQYHLLGGSHTMSRGFTAVACDYASIVASVEAVNGKDVLKAYIFNS
ncbi:hypothetical protein PGIGA_G00070200 [Pangasianodon gigas]|uniref:Uncharacterized protein n=1 Tax=Pangasianodon gigas TaxID=30993 RepID=A0ACC5X740_PANGG|nr:hypothetical protein [Pangasianodon gigas]